MHAPGKRPRTDPDGRSLTEESPSGTLRDRPDTIPHPPSLPADLLDLRYRGGLVGAPAWALAVVEEMHRTRDELSAAMGEFADAASALERQNREVLAHQSSLRRSVEELRSEFRSRVGAHDGELNDVRVRLDALERDLADLRAALLALKTE